MSAGAQCNGRSAWSSRCAASARARASIFSGVARRPASHVRYDSGDAPSIAANAACDWPSAIRQSRSVRGSTTSHHAIGAGRCEARGCARRTSVSQSWKVTGHFFACTFAPGAQAEGTIGEFFRKMARPAGFEPATLGLEGHRSTGAQQWPRFGESVINGGHILCTADCPHPPCFLRKKKGSACAGPLRR